jgi:hypothetical protein
VRALTDGAISINPANVIHEIIEPMQRPPAVDGCLRTRSARFVQASYSEPPGRYGQSNSMVGSDHRRVRLYFRRSA